MLHREFFQMLGRRFTPFAIITYWKCQQIDLFERILFRFRAKYQEPETKEGFSEIIKIPFVLDRSLKEIDLYCMHLLEK